MGDLPGVFQQGDRICSGAVNIGQPEFVFLSLQQKSLRLYPFRGIEDEGI